MINNRLARVRESMGKNGLEQIVITQPQSIYYLTGEWVEPHDRLDALVITQDKCRMLCYVLAVIHPEGCEVTIYSNTAKTVDHLSDLLDSVPTGIDGFMQTRFLLPLIQKRPDLNMHVSHCVEDVRMIKDADEIARLRYASEITDKVFAKALNFLQEGMTEFDLGRYFSEGFAELGAGRISGDPMVSFGEGTSDPHHAPGEFRLACGDTIWIDTGKRINGYYSDMTRTVFFKKASDEQKRVYETVLQANMAALEMVKPGNSINDVHRKACEVIEAAGYGEFYPHRTSHGIGIDYHEEPFSIEGRELILEPGMCFSVEPGIYLPGKFGVRIEDLVVVTENGYSKFTHAPKDFTILG